MRSVREAALVQAGLACGGRVLVAVAFALSLLISLMLGVASPARAYGTTAPDQARLCSLSAECLVPGNAVSGLQLSLYRVAAFTDEGPFALTDDFAASSVDLAGLSKASDWAAAASALDSYARATGLVPQATAVTASSGVASFSGLEPGLYLSLKATGDVNGEAYTCAAFLVSVPGEASDGISWNYHVAVAPKFERGTASDDADGSAGSVRTKLATTGDDARSFAAAAVSIAAIAAGLAGAATRARRAKV